MVKQRDYSFWTNASGKHNYHKLRQVQHELHKHKNSTTFKSTTEHGITITTVLLNVKSQLYHQQNSTEKDQLQHLLKEIQQC